MQLNTTFTQNKGRFSVKGETKEEVKESKGKGEKESREEIKSDIPQAG